MHEHFVRRGARLDAAGQAELGLINQQLAGAFTDFRAKILAEEDTWTTIAREADLDGLPESFAAAARSQAEERGLAGQWIVLNTRSSVDPFLTFARSRPLREEVWRRFKSRGDNRNANDTNSLIAAIVRLRARRAELLGFPSHAHWRMADTMARTPEAAQALMLKVWAAGVEQVRHDVAEMIAIAGSEGITGPIEPWDYLYLAEKRRKALFDVDETELTPYLQLDNIVAAALWAAGELYGLSFREITAQVPVFHPDVRVFEVTDGEGGPHRGVFYLDNFARPGKRSGAWASCYRPQQRLDGPATPIVSNNNNFLKPGPGEPALISLDDAVTLFHEFGHALHDLLQDVTHPWLSSPPWDFIELPSQLNEQWLLTEELLSRFARHHETGEAMPRSLVDKVRRAEAFNQGYQTVETQAAAILDMVLHSRRDGTFDARAFEREELARIGMPREIALRHRLPHFDHLFGSDAYSAGYYSYVWADVMAADAWEAFLEAGPWDPELARRFRTHLLSNGNVTDRGEAYRLFRGRDPDEKALLRRRGLPIGAPRPSAET
jgi:peptidyl-dipeptidase Dcp